jgi:uncharacterized protein YqkB
MGFFMRPIAEFPPFWYISIKDIYMANNIRIKYSDRQKWIANKATARIRKPFTGLLEGNMKDSRTLR